MGGWGEIEIKANSVQLKLELGLSLAKNNGVPDVYLAALLQHVSHTTLTKNCCFLEVKLFFPVLVNSRQVLIVVGEEIKLWQTCRFISD